MTSCIILARYASQVPCCIFLTLDKLTLIELQVLLDLHSRFFDALDREHRIPTKVVFLCHVSVNQVAVMKHFHLNIKDLLTSKRKEVLFGVTIVFSGVIPLGIPPQR